MALSFHKMSFSQVSHFVDLLKTYMDGCESRDVIEDVDSSMDISMQSVESENNEIISNNVRFVPSNRYLSVFTGQFVRVWIYWIKLSQTRFIRFTSGYLLY